MTRGIKNDNPHCYHKENKGKPCKLENCPREKYYMDRGVSYEDLMYEGCSYSSTTTGRMGTWTLKENASGKRGIN